MLQSKSFWNEETGEATYILYDEKKSNIQFVGTAKCHPDDRDMMSEKTGLTIAEKRSYIKFLLHMRDNYLKPMIQVLKQVQSTFSQRNDINGVKIIQSELNKKQRFLMEIRDELNFTKNDLKEEPVKTNYAAVYESDYGYVVINEDNEEAFYHILDEMDEISDEEFDNTLIEMYKNNKKIKSKYPRLLKKK